MQKTSITFYGKSPRLKMHQYIASLIIHQTTHKQEYRCVILILFALETFFIRNTAEKWE